MSSPVPTPVGESSEEGRAHLQRRVALFWKVMFLLCLFGVVMGASGAVAKPGWDFVITVALALEAAVAWWLCRQGQRSARFSRWVEAGALLLNASGSALLFRYTLAGFVHEHAVATAEGFAMADAYVSMLQLTGTAMMVAIRAAFIPSDRRRTLLLTIAVGTPIILASSTVVPTASGLAWRALDSIALPWLPATSIMIWSFVSVACAIITQVTHGLRLEVREARRLGQYVLENKLGEGGMGEVYRASHGMMRRPSALKLLRLERSSESSLQRFEREVQLTARLTHPNTITIFDYGRTDDGVFYYVMELLDGANLERVVEVGGPQAPGRVVRILSMACGALIEAHAIGLIHRDIKPANIMLCTRGGERDVVKLLDFGLVKQLEVDREVQLTGASTLTGTPQYMAPESIRAPEAVDARTDLYALGAVAYFLLAGREVFDGRSIVEVCSQHLHQKPEPLSVHGVNVPAELEALVLACLEKDPSRRPQSAAALRQQLEACRVPPWSDDDARHWWLAHQPELEPALAPSASGPKTIAVRGLRQTAS
ncbi:MAG TPA: serine/threonine-protein kinase [Polyangiaceae bacterium]|nr:serine/threonine-protein kinase [Polyangiaceae bacterium]